MARQPWSRIPMNLQLFADGDGGTGGAGTGDTSQQGGGTGTAGGAQQGDKTFTQADLDRIIQERLARERDKYKDYDQLKADAEAYRKQQEGQKTELQKAQEKAAQAEAQKTEALARANERLLKAEVKVLSVELGIVDPDAAYALMDRSAIKVNDDGSVAGVKEALEALLKTKAYLKKQGGGVGSASSPGGDKSVDVAAEARKLAEERQKPRAEAVGFNPWAR